MATHFPPLLKLFLHIYTLRPTYMCQISFEMLFPTIFGIIGRYRGNKISATVENGSCTSTPQGQHVYQILFELLLKCRFSCFDNMPLPWQRTFHHCPKICHAHLHFKANMCAIFNLKMLFPTISGIICRYHGNTLSFTVENVSCTTTPYSLLVCQNSL